MAVSSHRRTQIMKHAKHLHHPIQSPVTPADAGATKPEFHANPDEVALRAYYIFLSQGGQHGRDQDNWFEAESALKNEARSA